VKALHILGWLSVAVFVVAAITQSVWIALGAAAGWGTGIALAWREQGRRERENERAWLTSHSK
jgi:hypothetical protein